MKGKSTALIRFARDSYQISKRLWAMAEFSRLVRPGALRINASDGNKQVYVNTLNLFDSLLQCRLSIIQKLLRYGC
jgi:glucosylceramidase